MVALAPVESEMLASVTDAMQRQGLGGALVGVRNGTEVTLPAPGSAETIRRNEVALAAGSEPSLVAEAVAFLASSRSGATNHATIPVG